MQAEPSGKMAYLIHANPRSSYFGTYYPISNLFKIPEVKVYIF